MGMSSFSMSFLRSNEPSAASGGTDCVVMCSPDFRIVIMAMVNIRPVGVSMVRWSMLMPVCMPNPRGQVGMHMGMVAVVMTVRMLVGPSFVKMQVRVGFNEQKDDADDEHGCRHSMHGSESFSQHEYGEHYSEKWCSREHDLCTCGSNHLCGSNVQHNADPVRERPDDQSEGKSNESRRERRHNETNSNVYKARYGSFPECALARGNPVDKRRKMIVDAPTDAGQQNQCGRNKTSGYRSPGEHQRPEQSARHPSPADTREMIAKQDYAEHRCGGELQIQPKRNR